jgi:hypothetical protein
MPSVAIAAGLDVSTEWVEQRCKELASPSMLPARLVEHRRRTMTPRHRFNHILLRVPYSCADAAREFTTVSPNAE